MLDIAISAALAILTIVMAYLGVHVTLHPTEDPKTIRRYKWGFVASAALAVLLVIFQGVRNALSQATLQRQLARIENNTHEPPKVVVNVPPTVIPQHTHVVCEDARPPTDRPDVWLPFHEGQQAALNLGFANAGDFAVREPSTGFRIVLVPFHNYWLTFRKLASSVNITGPQGTIVAHTGGVIYATFNGPKFTHDDDVSEFYLGHKVLCDIGRVQWSDDTGRYETDCGGCFVSNLLGGSANWHNMPENNSEHNLHD